MMIETFSRALQYSAIGDAIGDPFEFRQNINPAEVRGFVRHDTSEIVITDDTQMSLFGLEALSRAQQPFDIAAVQRSYIDWYWTQQVAGPHTLTRHDSWLRRQREMCAFRAPGATCLSALDALQSGRTVYNDSKGCGAVMRLLPFVVLFEKFDPEAVVNFAIQTGLLTHQHEEIPFAVRVYMEVAYTLITGNQFLTAEVADHVNELILRDISHISEIGAGWTALECVDMAIWTMYHSVALEDCIVNSVAHDGDSDSVAAVACGLYGLGGGVGFCNATFVQCWDRLKERRIIETMIARFVNNHTLW